MTQITAALVKELREKTNVGMMDCKKALVATEGNLEEAIVYLRKSGLVKAVKKGDRVAAEGLVVLASDEKANTSCIVEVNCETDFVARESQFITFANEVASIAIKTGANAETIGEQAMGDSTVEQQRLLLIAQIGENITIRRIATVKSDGIVGSYLHGKSDGAKIGVLVSLDVNDIEVAKGLAMHIAAMKPMCISEADMPQDILDKEKDVFKNEIDTQHSSKPEDIKTRIFDQKVQGFLAENVLLQQKFIKDEKGKTTVQQFLAQNKAICANYVRFEVGEGIEKKSEDFVAEVMAQAKS